MRWCHGRQPATLLFWMALLACLAAVPAFAQESPEPMGWVADAIEQQGLVLGLLIILLGGLALNLTPCVYPLIPVTLAFFSSQAAGRSTRIVALAALYVLGLSTSYAVLGFVTAQAGALFGSWLQHPAVLLVVAATVVALALSSFGLYDLRLPSFITQRFGQASAGPLGAVSMGLVSGLIAAPCIGPFVASLVLFVVKQANPGLGFLVFFTLGVGMGLPYLLLGVAAGRASRLPKAGAWLVWTKKLIGLALLGLALYFLNPLLPMRVLWALAALVLFGGGIALGWLERAKGQGRRFVWVRRLTGTALILAAVGVVWPRPSPVPPVNWQPYTQAAFDQARRDYQPLLIDIYADWCLPCVELDHVTFRHPDVVAVLDDVVTLRLDVTDGVPEHAEPLLDEHRVYGVPTVLLFDRTGQERRTLRVLGFIPPGEMLKRLEQIQ